MQTEDRLFNTIYGRNLIGELKNIAPRPYLVVTMEDLWEKFKDDFDDGAVVKLVKTLEYDRIMAELDKLPHFESVIGMGGGQAVDYAKMAAWKTHLPLFQVPTSIATNAVFGHRAGIRFNSIVRYVGYVEPIAVYIDYDVIQNGPKALNRSGVCDVFCYHNAAFDWKYAHEKGKCEEKWPYDPDLAAKSTGVFQTVVDAIDDIHALNVRGIRILTEGLRWGGGAFHNAGWNPRHIEGTDHFLFYTLEYMTKKKFIHGQPVCLGIFTGALMQNNRADWILDLIHRAGVEIRPEGMGLTWDDVFAALKYEKEYVAKAGLWYTVINDFVVDDAFCKLVKEKIIKVYGEWKP
jgi:glycerol dehydrogenase-like iron-containing ADH family enzyme